MADGSGAFQNDDSFLAIDLMQARLFDGGNLCIRQRQSHGFGKCGGNCAHVDFVQIAAFLNACAHNHEAGAHERHVGKITMHAFTARRAHQRRGRAFEIASIGIRGKANVKACLRIRSVPGDLRCSGDLGDAIFRVGF